MQSSLRYLIAIAVLVNFSGLFIPLMDPDAGVYASLSKNMVLHHDYVNLWFQDQDWLDKPHFPFWITAVFFKVFGMHTWSYKLPGILFVMFGAWYTWLFTKKYYNKEVALWAVFILLTAEHILISNNDVRAEPFLTGLIIASIYHFSNALDKKWFWQLMAGCFFAGCAVMTKGIFTLVPIGGAIAGHLLLQKNWKQILHYKWIVALLFLVLFISPELAALRMQFDKHPEKIVYGKDHVSGIRFFLWDSQFGRFMNSGPIKGKGDPTFFLHTLLWAFLPWCILMYTGIADKIRRWKNAEMFTLSGSLITLLIFSLSRFQLPYYTNIIFPLLAIITAQLVTRLITNNNRFFRILQTTVSILIIVLGIALLIFYSPHVNLLFLIFPAFLLLLFIINNSAYVRSGLSTLILALLLNLIFYPDLLKYQSGNEMAFYVNKEHAGIPVSRIGLYIPSGEFYLKAPVTRTDTIPHDHSLCFISEEELNELKAREISFTILKEFNEYHVTMLSLKFLNPKTRGKTLQKRYLVRL
jgi:4-amino-4-deoxy-L-arabinose transferase-like glycosyltransferase